MCVIGIELTLENCETIYFKKDHIQGFSLYGLRTEINMAGKYLACNGFIIHTMGYSPEDSCINTEGCMIERLQRYHDITSIRVMYEDGTQDLVYVDWPEDDTSGGQYHSNQLIQIVDGAPIRQAIISQKMGAYPDYDRYFNQVHEDATNIVGVS